MLYLLCLAIRLYTHRQVEGYRSSAYHADSYNYETPLIPENPLMSILMGGISITACSIPFSKKIVGACISKHSLLGKILFNILLQMGTLQTSICFVAIMYIAYPILSAKKGVLIHTRFLFPFVHSYKNHISVYHKPQSCFT